MNTERYLIVTADDYGIGPETSRAILDLAGDGLVTCAVLLVTSPHAEAAVRQWRESPISLELGWHPCLTLDGPILPAGQVPSLVDGEGRFWSLGTFLKRLMLGRLAVGQIEAELRAQYARFIDLVGRPPTVVNSHHHVQVFPPLGRVLREVLAACRPLPYLRRIREPWTVLARVPGARAKRSLLTLVGRFEARRQADAGFTGNDWLCGVTNPPCVAEPRYLSRWLTRMPGKVVELTCHPGYLDTTLIGRDCDLDDGGLVRRLDELARLLNPAFRSACLKAGFTLVSPSDLAARQAHDKWHRLHAGSQTSGVSGPQFLSPEDVRPRSLDLVGDAYDSR